MKTEESHIYQFGNFVLDKNEHTLRSGPNQIHLRPKVFETLLYLVENPGKLVTKKNLLDKIWHNVIVTENTLSHCIDEVRQALNDNAQKPIFIRTIPRLGFKFIFEVKEIRHNNFSDEAGISKDSNNHQKKNKIFSSHFLKSKYFFPIISSIVLLSIIVFLFTSNNSNQNINSIAVLPFINLNTNQSQDYFADGMTETLISNLGKIKKLRVISRTSMMTFKNKSEPVPEIGRKLNADVVVEGSVLKDNDRIRITAKLIRTNTDKLLWVKSYERQIKDILILQDELSKEIAAEIKLKLSPNENLNIAQPGAVNPNAYIAYLKGRYFWNKRTSDGFEKAEQQFLKAIAYDSGYAQAYTGLSDTYTLLGNYGIIQINKAVAKAKKYASKAIALNETLAEAHVSLSACLYNEWNIIGAKKELERAIELNPNYATAHQWYAFTLIRSGSVEEGISEMKKASQLSPLSLRIQADLGRQFYYAWQYDKAINQYKKTLELDQNFPSAHSLLGLAYLKKGNYQNAINEIKKGMILRKSDYSRWLGYVYAVAGQRKKAVKMLDKLMTIWNKWHEGAADIALIYAGLGNRKEAFEWLKKAYNERDTQLLTLKIDPLWNDLHQDPRFQDLVNLIDKRIRK